MIDPTLVRALTALEEGDHLHLDTYFPQIPPGSDGWVWVLRELVQLLRGLEGTWSVSLPGGTVTEVPRFPIEPLDALQLSSKDGLLEPPAVWRVPSRAMIDRWEGENHLWRRVVEDGIVQRVSFSKSLEDAKNDESYWVIIGFDVEGAENQ